MTEFWKVVNRLLDAFDDIISVRGVLALGSLFGFLFIAYLVVDRLSNPPASELFAVLNLVLTPVAAAVGYYFGTRSNQPPRNGTP